MIQRHAACRGDRGWAGDAAQFEAELRETDPERLADLKLAAVQRDPFEVAGVTNSKKRGSQTIEFADMPVRGLPRLYHACLPFGRCTQGGAGSDRGEGIGGRERACLLLLQEGLIRRNGSLR